MTAFSHEPATLHIPFRFSAWHSLPSRPERHEHTFEATIALRGPIATETGMVVDILKVQPHLHELVLALDGQTLNGLDVLARAPSPVNLAARFPTCETLARYFGWVLTEKLEPILGPAVKLTTITVRLDDRSAELGHAILDLRG